VQESGPLVVTTWAGKGGIGKTTLALIVAYLLGRIGPTLLVNGDPRQLDGSVSDLVAKMKTPPPFDLVEEEDPKMLAQVRRAKRRRFVVIDGAPARDEERIAATINVSDLVLVPITVEWLEARGVMNSVRQHVRPSGRKYRLVFSRVPSNQLKAAERLRTSLETADIPAMRTVVRRYQAHQDAQSMGVPVTEGDWVNWDKAADDCYGLVDEVLEVLGQPERVERRVRPAS
jgi:cellulose biosynthesis protein BcsQ